MEALSLASRDRLDKIENDYFQRMDFLKGNFVSANASERHSGATKSTMDQVAREGLGRPFSGSFELRKK